MDIWQPNTGCVLVFVSETKNKLNLGYPATTC